MTATFEKLSETRYELHWNFVNVSDKFQNKGYASKIIDLLLGYINDTIKKMKKVSQIVLEYASNTPRGWIAYNQECKLYGFENKYIIELIKKLEKQKIDITSDKAIISIHKALGNKYDLVWKKIRTGKGLTKEREEFNKFEKVNTD
jgi:hypothetical protein